MGPAKQTLAWVDHDGAVRPLYQPSPTQVLQKLVRFSRKSPREHVQRVQSYLADGDWYWKLRNPGTDRTAYVIGLFGTGRLYINGLILDNIGERAKYFRHAIRVRPVPTSMIYTGHATIRYASRAQALPRVTSRILEAVRSRAADLIFIYRHPLDSLLTNWVWWRTYMRDKRMISSLAQIYGSTEALSADLERHFSDFTAFARGHADFFASLPGTPFLSFAEFVEETELFLQSATLSLRLEDFAVDPVKEFAKIVQVMSAKVDVSHLHLARPRAKPFGHLAVQHAVPRFADFVARLDPLTKERIEHMGYRIDGFSAGRAELGARPAPAAQFAQSPSVTVR
jgi:hypothetical protein